MCVCVYRKNIENIEKRNSNRKKNKENRFSRIFENVSI